MTIVRTTDEATSRGVIDLVDLIRHHDTSTAGPTTFGEPILEIGGYEKNVTAILKTRRASVVPPPPLRPRGSTAMDRERLLAAENKRQRRQERNKKLRKSGGDPND